MIHGQKAPRKPLFTDKKSADIFISLFVEEHHKIIAEALFVDGLTNEETANKIWYSKRQIERIKTYLLRTAVKRLIEKQIPKKPKYIEGDYDMPLCPQCGLSLDENEEENYCSVCGQELDWRETECPIKN